MPPETAPQPSRRSGRLSTPLLVGAIAGAIVVTAFVVSIARHRGPSSAPWFAAGGSSAPAAGRGAEGQPSIVSPIGTIPHGNLTLHWEPVPGIEEYEAVVYDTLANVLWRSGKLKGRSVDLPDSAMKSIVPGPTHFWRVIGYRPDGTEVPSPTVPIVLSP